MLNDLALVERAMADAGVDLADRHPDVKDMAKGAALRVRLAADGGVADLDIIPDAGNGATWTLRDGQHNGFPGLKTKTGLLALPEAERTAHAAAWKTANPLARLAELRRLAAACPVDPAVESGWPEPGHRRRIAERGAALRGLGAAPASAAVAAVFDRFLRALDRRPAFAADLAQRLVAYAGARGGDWIDMARAALVEPVALVIDVPAGEFARDASDPRQIGAVSAALAGQGGADAPSGRCALSGHDAPLHRGNFPQPNLPGLGQTYIFSRNADIPSLTRYGRTSDASFPLDAALARRLASAIAVLTTPPEQGRTWRLIPAECGDKPDLLVVSRPLASALCDDRREEEDDEDENAPRAGLAQWRSLGERLHEQLDAKASDHKPVEDVLVLVLRTVDPANRKAIYQRRLSAAEIFEAWTRWRAACANRPDWLSLPSPVKGERTLISLRPPPTLAPLSLTPDTAVRFTHGGRRRTPLVGVGAPEAFALFLGEGDARLRAARLLRLIVQRHGALLSGLAHARAKGTDALKTFDPRADLRAAALRSATWLGALLHRLDRDTETYMSDVAFRLGQLLWAVDRIHVGYCADMRGGATPPVLIGAAVFGVAGDDPARALAMLQQRIKPYLAWLGSGAMSRIRDRAEGLEGRGEKSRAIAMRAALSLPQRARALIEGLSGELRSYATRQEVADDAFRAELLLGYLAGLKPEPKTSAAAPAAGGADLAQGEQE